MTKKRKKRQTLQCVQSLPPACPKCHCTDRSAKEAITYIERDINGTTKDGRPFSKVQWNRTSCKNCGQYYKFMEYLYPANRADDDS